MSTDFLTLGEGGTPLLRSRGIGPSSGIQNLYFKLETTNPSGSFKDRFAAAAINDMLAKGKTLCLATSSGNTGAALAAYTAAAGILCHIAIVETAPESKLQQMHAYGAMLYRIKGFGLDVDVSNGVFNVLQEAASVEAAELQISAFKYSPIGMAGVRALSYELAEQQPQGIDHVFCPAGGGGLCVAAAEGFLELRQEGLIEFLPGVECVQTEGNNTIAGPLREGASTGQDITCTSTISGLQVPTNVDGDAAIRTCRATDGNGHLVNDESVYETQARLARVEGIFSEPAGATALAGALQAVESGEVSRDAVIVCLVTGSGFKDEKSLVKMAEDRSAPMLESVDLFREALEEAAG